MYMYVCYVYSSTCGNVMYICMCACVCVGNTDWLKCSRQLMVMTLHVVLHLVSWCDENWPFSCCKHLLLHVELAKPKPTAARCCREEGTTQCHCSVGTTLASHVPFYNYAGMVTCVNSSLLKIIENHETQNNSLVPRLPPDFTAVTSAAGMWTR